jgi:hypothetical protein
MSILRETGYTVVLELPELFSSLLILWGILQCKFKKSLWSYILAAFSLIFILGINIVSGSQANLPPFYIMAELMVVLICVKERIIKKIILYFIAYLSTYLITTVFELIFSVLLNSSMLVFRENIRMRLLILSLNISFVLMTSLLLKCKKKGIENQMNQVSLSYITVGLLGLLCCILVLGFVQIGRKTPINSTWDKVAVFSMLLVCIEFIIGTILLILLENSRKNHELQSQLKERYLNVQCNYYKKILENDNEIRKFKHDIKAHMGCIKILSNEKKYDELSHYISEVSKEIDNLLVSKIRSGNDTVDALINYLAGEAEKEDIHILLDGVLSKKVRISPLDLCKIFCNTISNSIEACRRLDSKQERNIYINIKTYKDTLFFTVENPVYYPVDISMLGRGTTKDDKKNHGLGIQNIIESTKKYNGTVKFINENCKFRVEILLPDVFQS